MFANQQGSLSCEWFESLSVATVNAMAAAMPNSRRFCFYNPVALSSRKIEIEVILKSNPSVVICVVPGFVHDCDHMFEMHGRLYQQ